MEIRNSLLRTPYVKSTYITVYIYIYMLCVCALSIGFLKVKTRNHTFHWLIGGSEGVNKGHRVGKHVTCDTAKLSVY